MSSNESTAAARLEMRGVTKRFGATLALDGVDFAVKAGEVRALVGENGAGKSTLVKILSGAVKSDAGAMILDGRPYRPANPLEARRAGVAMIYQELSLAPHLTVQENIVLGMEPGRLGLVNRARARDMAREALNRLGHPELDPGLRVGRLPLAGQQIVEVARALALGCRLLILDEPTSALSAEDADKLFAVIRKLRDQGRAIIYISHFLEEVMEIADRVTVLRDGRVAADRERAGLTAPGIADLMVGRRLTEMYPRSPRTPGEVLLEVANLSGAVKPASASLTLRRGEVLGIAGLVGAGRTELLRAVFGLDPVRSGQVKVGAWLGPASPGRRWDQGLGLLSENRQEEGLALGLSVSDNLTLSRLHGLGPCFLVLPSHQDRACARWLRELDVRLRGPGQKVRELSGGNQQKVALARLLHHDVDAFLLDEPTRGIDVGSKARVYWLIDRLAAGGDGRRPRAVLMVSSYLPELIGLCDRIAVMCRGRLGPARPAGELTERELMRQATGQGEAA